MATMILRGHKTLGRFGTPFPTVDAALDLIFENWTLDEGEILENGEPTGFFYDDLEIVME